MVGNNLDTLGKPVPQLVLTEMPINNSKKPVSQKWAAVFQAVTYVNPRSKITRGHLKDQIFDICFA